MIKNSLVLKYVAYIKVHKEDDFMLKYVNFLILDYCIDLCEFIQDLQEKENTILYLKNSIKKQIEVLLKDTNKIKNISLQKEDFQFLDKYVFKTFEYKFNKLKEIKENYLIAYLNVI